jgi:hypothetical protein
MGLLFLILGLVWWFPIGLFILAAFLVSRAIGHWHRPQFAGVGGPPSWGDAGRGQWESRMADRAPSLRGCGPGNWRNQPFASVLVSTPPVSSSRETPRVVISQL